MKEKLALLAIFLFSFAGAYAAPDSFAPIVKATRDGIVHINVVSVMDSGPYMNDYFFRWYFGVPNGGFETKGNGTGFIIDKAGYIITNNHVIDKAKDITVKTSDDREYKATLVGRDSLSDLALLKIEPVRGVELKALTIGDSDLMEIGDWVIAVGSPQGLGWTVTAGIVSAKGRDLSAGPYDSFIQTDASINPGNSGGPLLNTKGEVIGINTLIISNSQGLGFAVPSNMLKNVLPQLKSGYVRRGWIGVTLQNLDEELAKNLNLPDTKGAIIVEVLKNEPAAKAGLLSGDIIKEVDGKLIDSSRDLSQYIGGKMPGDVVKVTVIRDGKVVTKNVTLSERQSGDLPVSQTPDASSPLQIRDLSVGEKQNLGISDGVYITNVKPGSSMAKAGLNAGYVVLEINKSPVKSVNDFNSKYSKIAKGDSVLLKILGRSGQRYIAFAKE